MTIKKFFAAWSVLLLAACDTPSVDTTFDESVMPELPSGVVTADIGTVSAYPGKRGPIAIVFPEQHNAVDGQIEQAIVLQRLSTIGLEDLVLEGYLTGASELKHEWMGTPADTQAHDTYLVAAQLLGEGEISAAEFISTVTMVRLIRGETEQTYIEPSDEAEKFCGYLASGAVAYLVAEAETGRISDSDVASIQSIIEQFGAKTTAQDGLTSLISILKAKNSRLSESLSIACGQSADTSIGDELAAIPSRTELLNWTNDFEFSTKASESAEAFKAFLEARNRASDEIVSAMLSIPNLPSKKYVALVVGAAHLNRVRDLLTEKQFATIVIESLHLKSGNRRSALGGSQWANKTKRKSVDEQPLGIGGLLSGTMKPLPVIDQEWVRAKAQAYMLIDRAVGDLLAAGGAPPQLPPPANRYTLSDASADPGTFKIVTSDDGPAVMFQLTLLRGRATEKKLWVLARRSDAQAVPCCEGTKLLEDILKDVRSGIRSEPPQEKVAVVSPTRRSVAQIAINKDDLEQVKTS